MAERTSTERKSKRKAPPKVDETAEPTGLKKLLENPIVILVFIIVVIILLLLGIWGLAEFLSGG